MAYTSVDNYRGKKIYDIDSRKLAESIINFQNNIDAVSVNIHFPNRLNIQLYSSPPLFETFLRNKIYIITKNGTLIPSEKINTQLSHIEVYGNIETSSDFIDYKKVLE